MTQLLIVKYTGPNLPCTACPPHPLFHAASQRDGRAVPWVWMDGGAWAPCVTQACPFVLRSFLRECCVGRWGGWRWTRPTVCRVNGHARNIHARCALGALPPHSTCRTLSRTPEQLLMNTEGLRVLCGGRPSGSGAPTTLAARGHGRHHAQRAALWFLGGGASDVGMLNLGVF